MCLRTRMTHKERDKYLATQPEVMNVWKQMRRFSPSINYWAEFANYPFHAGVNVARSNCQGHCRTLHDYTPGFHSFRHRRDALVYPTPGSSQVVQCRVNKSDITEVGTWVNNSVIIVSSKITCPKRIGDGK